MQGKKKKSVVGHVLAVGEAAALVQAYPMQDDATTHPAPRSSLSLKFCAESRLSGELTSPPWRPFASKQCGLVQNN